MKELAFISMRRSASGRKLRYHGPERDGAPIVELGAYVKRVDGWPLRVNGRMYILDVYGLHRLANELRRAVRAIPEGYNASTNGQLTMRFGGRAGHHARGKR